VAQPRVSLRCHAATYQTRYWKTVREYRHMSWNNVALLSVWTLMCWWCGTVLFFAIYLSTVSVAGGLGIVLFTVQHNFKHSYATSTEHWDHDMGAIRGTSFLMLPGVLNWFTANIGYHHIHHLVPGIPNYRLAECHKDFEQLFSDVTRLRLSRVLGAWRRILWDTRAHRIVSVAEYEHDRVLCAAAGHGH
jgi:omega-6 fatty acid desaturase (delta-12 desaturase)